MENKNEKIGNKTKYIVSLVLFSLLITGCIYGLFKKIIDGDEMSSILLNVGVILFSLFWVIKDILALSGHPFKIIRFPIKILADIGSIMFMICASIAYVYILIHLLINGMYFYAIFFAFMSIGAVFGIRLFFKSAKLHFAAYYVISKLKKSNGIDTEKRNALIKQLLDSDSLQTIYDITCRGAAPYIDESGIVAVYDERKTADKARISISKNNKLSPYYQETTITKKDDFFQKCYDIGFETFNFVTEFGTIPLRFDELEIRKNDDPIHAFGTAFRIQHVIAKQYVNRYSHMVEKKFNKSECDDMLNKASVHTDLEVKEFLSSLFYVFTVPKGEKDSESVVKLSNHANSVCKMNNINFDNCEELKDKNFICVSENDDLIPFFYSTYQDSIHFLVFSKYKLAENTIGGYLIKLAEIEEKMKSAEWESDMKEAERIAMLRFRNYIMDIVGCEINLMSGAELADYAIRNKIQSIIVNDKEEVTSISLRSYDVKGDK